MGGCGCVSVWGWGSVPRKWGARHGAGVNGRQVAGALPGCRWCARTTGPAAGSPCPPLPPAACWCAAHSAAGRAPSCAPLLRCPAGCASRYGGIAGMSEQMGWTKVRSRQGGARCRGRARCSARPGAPRPRRLLATCPAASSLAPHTHAPPPPPSTPRRHPTRPSNPTPPRPTRPAPPPPGPAGKRRPAVCRRREQPAARGRGHPRAGPHLHRCRLRGRAGQRAQGVGAHPPASLTLDLAGPHTPTPPLAAWTRWPTGPRCRTPHTQAGRRRELEQPGAAAAAAAAAAPCTCAQRIVTVVETCQAELRSPWHHTTPGEHGLSLSGPACSAQQAG